MVLLGSLTEGVTEDAAVGGETTALGAAGAARFALRDLAGTGAAGAGLSAATAGRSDGWGAV